MIISTNKKNENMINDNSRTEKEDIGMEFFNKK